MRTQIWVQIYYIFFKYASKKGKSAFFFVLFLAYIKKKYYLCTGKQNNSFH